MEKIKQKNQFTESWLTSVWFHVYLISLRLIIYIAIPSAP